jgi:F0F1-type ATP synthase membrane subunit a
MELEKRESEENPIGNIQDGRLRRILLISFALFFFIVLSIPWKRWENFLIPALLITDMSFFLRDLNRHRDEKGSFVITEKLIARLSIGIVIFAGLVYLYLHINGFIH